MIVNGSRCYDISMLRDFLDHLLCELRLARAVLVGESNETTVELRELIEVYRQNTTSPQCWMSASSRTTFRRTQT
jgi:hypothetical protein